MLIHCTKKILDAARITDAGNDPDYADLTDKGLLFSWHANVVTIDRRKVLFFVNDLTGISVLFYRPKAADYRHLEAILTEGVTTLMKELGFREDVIQCYLEDDDRRGIYKSASRSRLGWLNTFGDELYWRVCDSFESDYGLQINAMIEAAHDIQRFDKEYDCRYERFVAAISGLYGDGNKESVLDLRSYILKIRIDLERHDVYRIVEVPANLTFHDLHRAIIEMFDWSGCHCHSFDVIEGDLHTPGPRYVMPIKTTIYDGDNPPDDELMGSDRAYLSDRTVILSDVFQTEDWCVYTYDLGDNWEHTITVQERKETGGSDRIRVIEANGQRPPEDVGGEYGYEEYLRIISDPDDPDHESAVQWGEEANPEELSMEDMNLRLSIIRF